LYYLQNTDYAISLQNNKSHTTNHKNHEKYTIV
jgi:hypothetical protein